MGGFFFLAFVRVGVVMGGLLSVQDYPFESSGLGLRRGREPEEVAPGRESV